MSIELPNELDARGSILFLGSGFSLAAKNIEGQSLPTGAELRTRLAALLPYDAGDYGLKVIADEVASLTNVNLYQVLHRKFTVQETEKDQDDILELPWYRIYTTNYDNLIEAVRLRNGRNLDSYSYDDDIPHKIPRGAVVHLHGTIGKATDSNVLQQLVVNEYAYARLHFEKSPWYQEFNRSLRFCSSCYFVGYSLSDSHMSAFLLQNPGTRDKTYFVTKMEPDRIFCNRVRPFGKVLSIGISGFADLCRTLPQVESVVSPHSIKSFRYLDPLKDRIKSYSPTAVEVLNLVTYGTFNFQRCFDSLPGREYVVPRESSVADAAERLKDARCLLVHSRIGNGKSVFLHLLAHRLSQQRYHCFLAQDDAELTPRDVEAIGSVTNPVLMFDSYNTAIDVIEQRSDLPRETKFVVSVRTSVQEVRLHEIRSKLATPMETINLNGLSSSEARDFLQLLTRSGIGTSELSSVMSRARDFRDVVVALYNNEMIRKKIEKELAPLLGDKNFRRVFVVSHILDWIGQRSDPSFIRSVTGCDPYVAVAKFREVSGDIFALDNGDVQVRSPIFSEYLVQNLLSTDDIIECVYDIVIETIKRRRQRRYQAILSRIMRVSILNDALRDDPNRVSSIRSLFERLRRDIEVNNWPLFWLQYSILMNESNDLTTAERFIRTAYDRAQSIPSFLTFQIDTYALKLFLIIERRQEHGWGVQRFEEIVEKMDRVRSMIVEESRRWHAIQALQHIEPFVVARISSLSNSEKIAIVQHSNLLIDELERLTTEERKIAKSDLVKDSLERTSRFIVRFDAETVADS